VADLHLALLSMRISCNDMTFQSKSGSPHFSGEGKSHRVQKRPLWRGFKQQRYLHYYCRRANSSATHRRADSPGYYPLPGDVSSRVKLPESVTISIGLATTEDPKTVETELLNRADDALYQAKSRKELCGCLAEVLLYSIASTINRQQHAFCVQYRVAWASTCRPADSTLSGQQRSQALV
jgi:hypothetical protein